MKRFLVFVLLAALTLSLCACSTPAGSGDSSKTPAGSGSSTGSGTPAGGSSGTGAGTNDPAQGGSTAQDGSGSQQGGGEQPQDGWIRFEGQYGYSVEYDAQLFDAVNADRADRITAKANDGATPNVYLSVQLFTDRTPEELRDGLIHQSPAESCLSGSETVGEDGVTAVTVFYEYTAPNGETSSSMYLVETASGVLLFEFGRPAADEDAQSTFRRMLESLRIDEAAAAQPGGSSEPGAGTDTASAILELARSLVGAPYEWGASGPDTFDNSGFVWYCFTENGVEIPRRTSEMFEAGTSVEQENLLPGDLVFFTYNEDGSVSYVALYLGDGQMIAENNVDKPVKIMDMTTEYFQSRFVGARRFLNQG
jgi:cell wall-associated NlpC family hydrolase